MHSNKIEGDSGRFLGLMSCQLAQDLPMVGAGRDLQRSEYVVVRCPKGSKEVSENMSYPIERRVILVLGTVVVYINCVYMSHQNLAWE